MLLTVLGSSASQPAAGDACSGYLVSAGETHVLLDCGSGVLGRLQEYAGIDDLNAIVISHLHPDHYIDLVALRYGRRYGTGGTRAVEVHLPPGGIAHLETLGAALSQTQPFWDGALTLHEYEPGIELGFDEISVRPHEVMHGIRSFGSLIEHNDRRLAYSSDTVPCDELRALAADAHVLLAEATLGGGAPAHHEPTTHLSAEDAARVASDADVEQLVLTHFWHTADRDLAASEARAVFAGQVTVARPGVQIEV